MRRLSQVPGCYDLLDDRAPRLSGHACHLERAETVWAAQDVLVEPAPRVARVAPVRVERRRELLDEARDGHVAVGLQGREAGEPLARAAALLVEAQAGRLEAELRVAAEDEDHLLASHLAVVVAPARADALDRAAAAFARLWREHPFYDPPALAEVLGSLVEDPAWRPDP